eukprot:c6901_g1_i1 orf=79-264(+)
MPTWLLPSSSTIWEIFNSANHNSISRYNSCLLGQLPVLPKFVRIFINSKVQFNLKRHSSRK